jgi:signal transduction histidine kinase
MMTMIAAAEPLPWYRVARAGRDRMALGVCAGWARRYGVDVYVARLTLLVLTLLGGLGAALYVMAWALSQPGDDSEATPFPSAVVASRSMAVGAGGAAVAMVCRSIGLWPGDAVMLPAMVVAAGSALLSFQSRGHAPASGDPLARMMAPGSSAWRTAAGIALSIAGLVALVARGVAVREVPSTLAALATALAGAAVIAGPYVGRLTTQLRDEERARIRTEERAGMAAQLHDSVLQTLALMQRSADDPRRMVTLARRQERELRSWLYGATTPAGASPGLAALVETIAAQVEDDYHVRVDLVLVADTEVTPAVEALCGAMREALVNAAKHSGQDVVAVFVEVQPAQVVAFVRDTGKGFDASLSPPRGRGIDLSVRERLAHVGGQAILTTTPGGGAEWELVVPR